MSDSPYFPVGCFHNNPDYDWVSRGMYEYKLRIANEEPLCNVEQSTGDRYRFFTSEGFSGVVRIEALGPDYELTAKALKLTRSGTFSLFHPSESDGARWSVKEYRGRLRPREYRRFQKLLENANLWDMPTWEEIYGCDGYRCVEVQSGTRYHVVDRWGAAGDFRRLCEYFVELFNDVTSRSRPWWRLGRKRLDSSR